MATASFGFVGCDEGRPTTRATRATPPAAMHSIRPPRPSTLVSNQKA